MTMLRRRLIEVAPMWAICCALCACSNDDESAGIAVSLPHFHDPTSASAAIQTAARAVVRLHTARSFGTGAYISATGLILTNNHVLGEPVCPKEGCYVEVAQLHQRGEPRQDAETFLAIPVAIDVGLDVAVVQLVDPVTREKPGTLSYLDFDETEAEALLDQHVTVVGHPEGNLKKWTDGIVVSSSGKWFTSTAYVLPGDSGSPILNDAGKIVGLVHRAPSSLDLISEQGVNVFSVGTASAPVKAAISAPLPTTLVSVVAETTEEEFVANELLYLNARASTLTIGGVSVDAIDALGRACDSAVSHSGFASLDELDETLTPCFAAATWLECRADAEPVAYGVVCPKEESRSAWRNRFQTVNSLQLAMNGIADYYSVGPVIARLETSKALGKAAGALSLQQLLTATSPSLNFEVAYYLAMFGIVTYGGVSVSDFITRYTNAPHYELGAEYIAYSASWLVANQAITPAKLIALLKQLVSDPKVSIGAKLSIEDYLYELELL